jgi:predicted regulator of Ras-like GTPase activity (Roadblock/LC7/MglB family)
MIGALSSLGPDDFRRIDRLLHSFVVEAGARCALLLDRHGHPLARYGDTDGLDETSFASLAAADFDASDELAGLLGEKEFTSLYHQGRDGSLYLAEIGAIAILAAVFDRRTTLGMVRLKTREVLPRLVAVLEDLKDRPAREPRLGVDWTDDAVVEIDRLFAG